MTTNDDDDSAIRQRVLPCYLSCGCTTGFRCKPSVGDELICTFHDSPVRVIRKPTTDADKVA